MRSEDLSGIPESIEAWKVGELLEGLGFKPGSYVNVAEILIEPRSVTVHAYATNEEGKRYLADAETYTDPKTRSEPAMHEISIPFVGGWEKPATAGPAEGDCGAFSASSIGRTWCVRAAGHADEHEDQDGYRWVTTAGKRCDSRGPDGIRCHLDEGHSSQHQLGSVYWA